MIKVNIRNHLHLYTVVSTLSTICVPLGQNTEVHHQTITKKVECW